MPLMGSSRSLGFTTRSRICTRCEKMSALCTFIVTTLSCGASSLKVDAQPEQTSSVSKVDSVARRFVSGMAMGEHVGCHQHNSLLRYEEALCVLGAIEPDARARRDLAIGIDDGVADLAVGADPHVRQDDRAFDHRALLDTHSG